MSSTAGRIATKAGIATAVVGGGALFFGGQSASAQEAPEVPPWLQDLGQQLLTEYGPQIAELQGKVDEFIQGLRPEDDPSTAEVEATPTNSSGTAWQDESGDFVLGRSEATPTSARVVIFRAFGQDILTREGDETGGTYGGAAPWLGQGIDWINDQTCPSGVHGGEDLCITFLDSSATTRYSEPSEEVSQTLPVAPLVGNVFTEAQINSIPLISNSTKTALKAARTNYLNSLAGTTVTATGTSEGVSTDNDASFHLIKGSKGGDSITLFPTSAHSGSVEFAAGPLTTSAFSVPNPLRAILPPVVGSTTATFLFNTFPSAFPTNINVPSTTVQSPGTPQTCTSSASANTIDGTGTFAELADFFGTPKEAIDSAECDIEIVAPTSGNTP